MSTANDIALAVYARMVTISVANGFNTDIGLKSFRGRKRLDKANMPCVVLIERDDQPNGQTLQRTPQVKVKQKYVLEGHAPCDADNPNDMGHKIIADLKKAIWSTPFVYGTDQRAIVVTYEGKSIAPREDGIDVVAAAVEISVEFVESLSNP